MFRWQNCHFSQRHQTMNLHQRFQLTLGLCKLCSTTFLYFQTLISWPFEEHQPKSWFKARLGRVLWCKRKQIQPHVPASYCAGDVSMTSLLLQSFTTGYSSRLHSRNIIGNWSINLFFCSSQICVHLEKDWTRKIKPEREKERNGNNLLRRHTEIQWKFSIVIKNYSIYVEFDLKFSFSALFFMMCYRALLGRENIFVNSAKVFSPQLDCLAIASWY